MAKERQAPKEPVVYENNGLDEPPDVSPDETGILWASRVDALQREREAYDKRGMDDRVAAVDAELERLGYRAGAGNVAEDTRSVPVAETSRALPKETPSAQTSESASSADDATAPRSGKRGPSSPR